MIDLTPLDVRNKRGDFKRLLRGYDPQEVDVFLELIAERLEIVVRENIQFRERVDSLQQQVASQEGRERAVQEALVTAQELRNEMKTHAQRQAELILSEAQSEARRVLAEADAAVRTRFREAERKLDEAQDALLELERRRERFLKGFRQLLERELEVVEVEGQRRPLEERPIEMDLGGVRDEAPETHPPLDAAVDRLASEYQKGEGTRADAEASGDLFPFPDEQDRDDPRWG